jgi:hypothetical protein
MDEGKDGWQGRHDSTDQIYKVIWGLSGKIKSDW